MAEVKSVQIWGDLTLDALKPGECFVTQYEWNKFGKDAQVWMKVETRHYNPNDESKPKISFTTINLRTGMNGGQQLNCPVFRIKVKIEPILETRE